MKRTFIALVVLIVLALGASSVLASAGTGAHYVTGPTITVSGNTLTVSGKAAGLGNVATTDIALTGTINVSSRCYTKSGNKPQAANKQETINVDEGGSFPVRAGSVTFSFSVTPLSTLSCPKGQIVVIESISYDLFLTWAEVAALDAEFVSP